MAGWFGHVGWLIADALPTKWSHGPRPAISLQQDRESSPAMTGVLTTMLHHRLQAKLWVRQFQASLYLNGFRDDKRRATTAITQQHATAMMRCSFLRLYINRLQQLQLHVPYIMHVNSSHAIRYPHRFMLKLAVQPVKLTGVSVFHRLRNTE